MTPVKIGQSQAQAQSKAIGHELHEKVIYTLNVSRTGFREGVVGEALEPSSQFAHRVRSVFLAGRSKGRRQRLSSCNSFAALLKQMSARTLAASGTWSMNSAASSMDSNG